MASGAHLSQLDLGVGTLSCRHRQVRAAPRLGPPLTFLRTAPTSPHRCSPHTACRVLNRLQVSFAFKPDVALAAARAPRPASTDVARTSRPSRPASAAAVSLPARPATARSAASVPSAAAPAGNAQAKPRVVAQQEEEEAPVVCVGTPLQLQEQRRQPQDDGQRGRTAGAPSAAGVELAGTSRAQQPPLTPSLAAALAQRASLEARRSEASTAGSTHPQLPAPSARLRRRSRPGSAAGSVAGSVGAASSQWHTFPAASGCGAPAAAQGLAGLPQSPGVALGITHLGAPHGSPRQGQERRGVAGGGQDAARAAPQAAAASHAHGPEPTQPRPAPSTQLLQLDRRCGSAQRSDHAAPAEGSHAAVRSSARPARQSQAGGASAARPHAPTATSAHQPGGASAHNPGPEAAQGSQAPGLTAFALAQHARLQQHHPQPHTTSGRGSVAQSAHMGAWDAPPPLRPASAAAPPGTTRPQHHSAPPQPLHGLAYRSARMAPVHAGLLTFLERRAQRERG